MNIEISPELEKDFKRFVLEKHGKLRGKLGEEMEKAISFYIENPELIDNFEYKKDIRDTKARE
jgi:hypothetical protein